MTLRTWTLLPLLLFPALAACAEKKDLSPPPLNPHPKEALHVTVTFDHPDDARRYVVVMRALYQNQQSECGYFDPLRGGGSFVYPHGTFDIPDESRDPQHAQFNIYLDRYNRNTCNWELASPDFLIRDTYTGIEASGNWGLREDRVPGTKYRAVCLFQETDLPQNCYGRWPMPDKLYYSSIPITVYVSVDSSPPRPRVSGYFSSDHFAKRVKLDDALTPLSPGGND